MHRRLISLFTIALVLLGVLSCGYPGDIGEEFKFESDQSKQDKIVFTQGRVPSQTVIKLLQNNAPLIEVIEDKLNVDMEVKFAKDYSHIIENMKAEKYSAALLGPLAAIRYEDAVDTIAYTPLVRPLRYGGKDHYSGIIFTRKENGIDSLEDLKGKTMAFVDRDSASGYLFPRARLMEAGINSETDLQETKFLGRHNLVVQAVHKGTIDAGATFKGARPGALPDGVKADEALPVLAETREIPTSPIMIHKGFKKKHPELVKKLQKLLVNLYTHHQGLQALNKIDVDRYIKAKYSDYDEVRKVFETLESR